MLALVVFVLSNRVPVTVGFWPFGEMPLWLGPLVVGALAVGFILGLLFHLPAHIGLRRRARKAEKRAAELEAKLAAPAASAPRPVIVPPAI